MPVHAREELTDKRSAPTDDALLADTALTALTPLQTHAISIT